jgi:hypothetical protein
MRFGRYLALMAPSWVLAGGAVFGFTLLVDAIGISPIRVAVAGFNAWKPLRQDYDWIVKRYDIWRSQPTTIFLGSSRVKQTIDPSLLAQTGFASAYNAGINGAATFPELKPYLLYALSSDKNLHHVFIEAFAPGMLSHHERKPRPAAQPGVGSAVPADEEIDPLLHGPRRIRPKMIQFGLANDIGDFASAFFSASAVSSAIRTIAANREQKSPALLGASEDGYVPVPLAPHHFSVRNVFNFVLHHPDFMQRGGWLDDSLMAPAKHMIANCAWYQVQCRFFLSPLHADVLLAAFRLGLWPEFENLKRKLAVLAPTYDFTRYNRTIEERIDPVLYWPEAFHYSPALGELVTKALVGLRTPDMPDNFGVLIEPKNMDANLAAWRAERDSWIARHPDVVARMQKAEDNLRNGMSFKAVTDAEIAAGGW